jgi:hypothetical protein
MLEREQARACGVDDGNAGAVHGRVKSTWRAAGAHRLDVPNAQTLRPCQFVEETYGDSVEDVELAVDLMERFAARTGLTSSHPQRRYLWTDAFAVCNFLALDRVDLALALVDRVHHVLGRHREDDVRTGWISGLPEADGEAHPTHGGLRIGKLLPERLADEPMSERLEWERDGQYFHYLTKWMHALDQVAHVTGDPHPAAWARELAETARTHFVHAGRMYWKMSIDLSRPQIATMGHHDPLDGYVTELELGLSGDAYRALIDARGLATADPLGLGGLLVDACRLGTLGRDALLRDAVLDAAECGLQAYAEWPDHRLAAGYRLAFRELGLAIGLAAEPLANRLRDEIVAFWCEPANRRVATWCEHEDINEVMLATALAPDGFLGHGRWTRPGSTFTGIGGSSSIR